MRLRENDREAIKQAALEVFGDTAVVRLFGSRIDDTLKGGDIDLHVEVDDLGREEFPSRRTQLWAELQFRLGEQKIDIVLTRRGRPLKPIEKIAYRDGLVL